MENQYNQPQFSNSYPRPLPNATAVLVLGIVSIALCFCYGVVGVICGGIALYLAGKDKQLYLQSPASYTESSYKNLNAGRICAIIGLILSILYILMVIGSLIFFGKSFFYNYQEMLRHSS